MAIFQDQADPAASIGNIGGLIGGIAFWLDPFTSLRPASGLKDLLLAVILGWLLIPSPDIRGWGETHQLNGPSWSLLQEYIANILYASIVRKFSRGMLGILVTVSAFALIITAIKRGDIGTGWSYQTFWIAIVRMMFPFFAGLLLFRTGKLIRVPKAFLICTSLLVIIFFVPYTRFNGIFEAGAIILICPLIVSVSAGGTVNGIWKWIYITHYPFIYIYSMWIYEKKPTPGLLLPVAIGSFFFFLLLAYLALKWFDEPVRNWLKSRY